MKSIILPSSHIIFDYFPNLESENKSFTEFKNETKHKLKMIYTDSDRFVLQREIISTEHVNWRYPLMTPYFIKEEIKNKNVLHIGSRGGELDEGMGAYAKFILSVKLQNEWCQISRKRKIKCERRLVNSKSQDLTSDDLKNIEVCYTYTNFKDDPILIRDAYHKNNSIIFYVVCAQQEDKLRPLLNDLRLFSEENELEVDYVPILFDESVDYQKLYSNDESYLPPQYPVIAPTVFTDLKNNEWNSTETFGDQWGVMLLLKLG